MANASGNQATVDRTESAAEAARRITGSHARGVTVVDDGTVCGVLTCWDFVARLVAQGKDPSTPVAEIVGDADVASPETGNRESLAGGKVTRPGVSVRAPGGCPLDWDAARVAIEIVCGKWVLSVVEELTEGPKRHNQLSRAIRLDHKRLGRVLRHLLEAQIVAKELDVQAQQVPQARYQLTPSGTDLLPVLAALGSWSKSKARARG